MYPNIFTAKKLLKWSPKYSILSGLKKTIKSYSEKLNSKPLVSIIMNCYNGEKYLRKSIKSILKQSYNNWELIFFDNKSSDKVRKSFPNLQTKDLNIFIQINI